MILLIAFVVLLASMPPIQIMEQPDSWTGYEFKVNMKDWGRTAEGYWDTLKTGSLGVDRKKQPVAPIIATRFKNSLTLLGLAAALAAGLGVLKGLWDFSSMRRRRGLAPAITSAVQGIPDFWLILVFQMLAIWLYNHYGWRPFRIIYNSEDQFGSLLVPVLVLALIPGSYVARITATALANVWEREYIRTARAKGVHEFYVLFRHAMRNAAVQILDGLPNVAAVMVANLLIVEYMFRFPGLTTKLFEAIPKWPLNGPSVPADVPVLAAAGFCLGLTFSLLHLIVSAARRLADPRLRERDAA